MTKRDKHIPVGRKIGQTERLRIPQIFSQAKYFNCELSSGASYTEITSLRGHKYTDTKVTHLKKSFTEMVAVNVGLTPSHEVSLC